MKGTKPKAFRVLPEQDIEVEQAQTGFNEVEVKTPAKPKVRRRHVEPTSLMVMWSTAVII